MRSWHTSDFSSLSGVNIFIAIAAAYNLFGDDMTAGESDDLTIAVDD